MVPCTECAKLRQATPLQITITTATTMIVAITIIITLPILTFAKMAKHKKDAHLSEAGFFARLETLPGSAFSMRPYLELGDLE